MGDSTDDNNKSVSTGQPSISQEIKESSDPNCNGSIRSFVGESMARFSTLINENKIAARYGVVATVGVLSAYAISQTSLFFRYKVTSEIPSNFFRNRRKIITGRLMLCTGSSNREAGSFSGNDTNMISTSNSSNSTSTTGRNNAHTDVICYLRHLSPIERMLPKTWWNRLLGMHPSASFSNGKLEERADELIRVQVAGIQWALANNSSSSAHGVAHPQSTHTSTGSSVNLASLHPIATNEDIPTIKIGKSWIHSLSSQRVLVSCQLLGRIVPRRDHQHQVLLNSTTYSTGREKRPIPYSTGISSEPLDVDDASVNDSSDQTVVAKIFFRPNYMQWFSTDLGEWMVRHGYAVVSDNGMYGQSTSTSIEHVVDTSDCNRTLRSDVAYIERLSQAEHVAASESRGVWRDAHYRTSRSDLVDEVTFQQTATIWQKLWRRLTQG